MIITRTLIPAQPGWSILCGDRFETDDVWVTTHPVIAWHIQIEAYDENDDEPNTYPYPVCAEATSQPCVWCDPNGRLFAPEDRDFEDLDAVKRYFHAELYKKKAQA